MIFHYGGKYNGDENSLPQKEHKPNAVPFKESDDIKKMAFIANMGSIVTMLVLVIPFLLLGRKFILDQAIWMPLAACSEVFLCCRTSCCTPYATKKMYICIMILHMV